MFQSEKPESKTSSILGPELEIHGDVKVSGSLLIYGKVFGSIHSSGAVRTANGSVVNGNISAKEAAIGGKIIARETVASFRKDVTQKLYGGDVTRKNKLLDKQKKGKKRMRQFGKVDIPQNAFLNALKMTNN